MGRTPVLWLMDPGAGHPRLGPALVHLKMQVFRGGRLEQCCSQGPGPHRKVGGCSQLSRAPGSPEWPCLGRWRAPCLLSLRCSGHLAPHLQKRDEWESPPSSRHHSLHQLFPLELNLRQFCQTRTRGQRGPTSKGQ